MSHKYEPSNIRQAAGKPSSNFYPRALSNSRCRANMAHTRQSRSDSGLSMLVTVLTPVQVVPSSLFCCTLVTGPRRSLRLKLRDTRVYEPQTRARKRTTLWRRRIPSRGSYIRVQGFRVSGLFFGAKSLGVGTSSSGAWAQRVSCQTGNPDPPTPYRGTSLIRKRPPH